MRCLLNSHDSDQGHERHDVTKWLNTISTSFWKSSHHFQHNPNKKDHKFKYQKTAGGPNIPERNGNNPISNYNLYCSTFETATSSKVSYQPGGTVIRGKKKRDVPFTVTRVIDRIIAVRGRINLKPLNNSKFLPMVPKMNDADLEKCMTKIEIYSTYLTKKLLEQLFPVQSLKISDSRYNSKASLDANSLINGLLERKAFVDVHENRVPTRDSVK